LGVSVTLASAGAVLPMTTVLEVTGEPELEPSVGVTMHATVSSRSNQVPVRVVLFAEIVTPETTQAVA
jgi:hypothetical protein